MDLQSSIIGLRVLCLSPKRNFYPKVAFMLNQTHVYVQLSSKRAFQPLKAETNRHLLFYTLSSSSHFSSLKKSSASEVVKLSSRRHELTVEGHDLSPVVCSSLSPSLHVHCCFVEMLLCDFFFLLKFIFQDFVEYRNV